MNNPLSSHLPAIDVTHPHPARMYDYFLGGKDFYPVDQEAAVRAEAAYPGIGHAARRNRAFLHRAGRYLSQQLGIRQYLDIGTGIMTAPNLHDIVWATHPDAKFVYVDRDATVLAHAEPFVKLSGGRAEYVHADVSETDRILRRAKDHLDFSEPIALSLVALWHFIPDDYSPLGDSIFHPEEIMKDLISPLAHGSHVVLSHVTGDLQPDQGKALTGIYRAGGTPAQVRSHGKIMELFGGLPMVDPGLVEIDAWRPDLGEPAPVEQPVPVYAGIARKQ